MITEKDFILDCVSPSGVITQAWNYGIFTLFYQRYPNNKTIVNTFTSLKDFIDHFEWTDWMLAGIKNKFFEDAISYHLSKDIKLLHGETSEYD